MHRLTPTVLAAAGVALTLSALPAPRAEATPVFLKQFKAVYLTEETSEEYTELVGKAKCYVCHQGKSKKNRNAYGEAFAGLLTKKEKDKEKIVAAIKEVGAMHSDADDESSPTYDELITEGKLPAGELEDLKEEPTEE